MGDIRARKLIVMMYTNTLVSLASTLKQLVNHVHATTASIRLTTVATEALDLVLLRLMPNMDVVGICCAKLWMCAQFRDCA
jgi:hypothetical protein